MKAIKFLAIALTSVVLLGACSKDDSSNGNKPESGLETYAGVKVVMPALTRAADENASDAESAIKSIGVYIVDVNTDALHSAVLTSDMFTIEGVTASATAAVKTVTGTKDIYVIVNPSATVTAKISSMNGYAFKNILDLAETSYYSGTLADITSVTMTGEKKGHNMNTVMSKENAVLAGNLVSINVDRNLAKVVVKEKKGESASALKVQGGDATDIKFAMVSKANNSYISSSLVASAGTPFATPPASPDVSYFSNFSTLTPAAGDYMDIVAYNTASKDAKGFYVLENAPAKHLVGNTTAARIKLKYTPKKDKGSVIVSTWAAGADDPTIVYGESIDGTFYVYKADGSYWTEAAYTAITTADASKAAQFSGKYDGGICYYKIYVSENSEAAKKVQRNYYYELSISEIKGPGKWSIDEGGEEKPTNPVLEDTWLGVSVSVKPWTFKPSEWIIQ